MQSTLCLIQCTESILRVYGKCWAHKQRIFFFLRYQDTSPKDYNVSALFWRRQTFNKSSNNITIIYSFEVPVSKVNKESSSTQVGNEGEKAIRFVKIVSGWFLKCRLIKMIFLQNYQLATPSQNFSKKVQKNIANELNFVQPVD